MGCRVLCSRSSIAQIIVDEGDGPSSLESALRPIPRGRCPLPGRVKTPVDFLSVRCRYGQPPAVTEDVAVVEGVFERSGRPR